MKNKKFDFSEYFYHGLTIEMLNRKNIKFCLQKLVNIIRAGAILSRNSISETYGKEYFNKLEEHMSGVNWNGGDYVCICERNDSGFNGEAFSFFVKDGISLLLDKALLEESELDKSTNHKFQDGEIRVKDRIDIKYVRGILIAGINPNDAAVYKRDNDGYTKEELEKYLKDLYQDCYYDKVFKILEFYNLNWPVYCVMGREEIKSVEETINETFNGEKEK